MSKISIIEKFAQDAINAPALVTGGKKCGGSRKSGKKSGKSRKSGKSHKSGKSRKSGSGNCGCPPVPPTKW